MIFDNATWALHCGSTEIVDCAIRDKDNYYFALSEKKEVDDGYWSKKKFLFVYADLPLNRRFYSAGYENFDTTYIAFNHYPRNELIGIDTHGTVYSYDIKRDGLEKKLDTKIAGTQYSAAITKLVRANGRLYALALARRLFLREDFQKWSLVDGISVPEGFIQDTTSPLDDAFSDLSAFSEIDMYGVGGDGDVWHFNGTGWAQIPFPTNDRLFAVCCAGDGNVYISSGWDNSIWMGRENRWKRIVEGDMNLPFDDMVWFAGRLWCGNSYGLWFLRDNELVPIAEEKSLKLAANCGRLDVSPDGKLMLTASPIGAALYDGEKWEILFNKYQLE